MTINFAHSPNMLFLFPRIHLVPYVYWLRIRRKKFALSKLPDDLKGIYSSISEKSRSWVMIWGWQRKTNGKYWLFVNLQCKQKKSFYVLEYAKQQKQHEIGLSFWAKQIEILNFNPR